MQHHLRDPSRDHTHGRVYRVVCKDRPLLTPTKIAGEPIPALLECLKSPEDRVRYRARIELSGRPSAEVATVAHAWARAQSDVHDRLEGLWLQAQHGVLDLELASALLASDEPRARAAALRVVRHQRRSAPSAEALCAAAVLDENPRVRLEAVVALSCFPYARAAEAALHVLDREHDAALDYALGETLRQLAPYWRAELSSGRPFAADHPAGLAHALTLLSDAELASVAPSAPLWRERLARPSTTREELLAALDGLAAAQKTGRTDELLAAIGRADRTTDAHADHVLAQLFSLARELDLAQQTGRLRPLIESAARATTRRLALALCLEQRATLDELWRERAPHPAELAQLLDAGVFVATPASRAELVRRAAELLASWQPAAASFGTPVRYVRVELPGPARTLTLAEVEIESGGENVARGGRASQSSVAWSGVPSERSTATATARTRPAARRTRSRTSPIPGGRSTSVASTPSSACGSSIAPTGTSPRASTAASCARSTPSGARCSSRAAARPERVWSSSWAPATRLRPARPRGSSGRWVRSGRTRWSA
jgi:hypothetical protein